MQELNLQQFGKNVRSLRKAKRMTQKELARKIDLTDATISKWEDGLINPGLTHVIKLCQLLNVDLDALLGLEKKSWSCAPN